MSYKADYYGVKKSWDDDYYNIDWLEQKMKIKVTRRGKLLRYIDRKKIKCKCGKHCYHVRYKNKLYSVDSGTIRV